MAAVHQGPSSPSIARLFRRNSSRAGCSVTCVAPSPARLPSAAAPSAMRTGNTVLDEVGDMDFTMQAKMLRALQERSVTPLGGRPGRVDVRVLAAMNRDLAAAGFREDLFYRLNVVPIHLASLHERLSDIVPLAEHFLRLATDPTKRLGPKRQRGCWRTPGQAMIASSRMRSSAWRSFAAARRRLAGSRLPHRIGPRATWRR